MRLKHADITKVVFRDWSVVQGPALAVQIERRPALPRDGFFVPELSQVGFGSYFGLPVCEPRTYVSEGYQGTLGFGFAPGGPAPRQPHPRGPDRCRSSYNRSLIRL